MTEAAAIATPVLASAPTAPRQSLWTRLLGGIRLQHMLFLALTAVAAIPVVTLDIWESQASFQREVDSVRERHLLVARNLTSTLSRYVVDLTAAFQSAFATGRLNPDTPGLASLLDSLDFVHICEMAPDGSVESVLPVQKSAALAAIGPRLFAELQALVASQRGTPSDQVVMSGLKRDPNGRPSFYLVKRLANNRLAVGEITTDYLVRLQSVIAFGERGHAVIVDANGLTIAHPFKDWAARMQDLSAVSTVKLMMARQTGVDTFFSPAFKGDMIAGYSFVPESGWGVMVPQPLSELKRRAREIDWAAWVVGGVALAIAAALSLLISRFLANPVRRVASTADAILAGDSQAKVPDFVGLVPQEIRRLGRAFNTMVDGLQRRNAQTREALKQAEISSNVKSQFLTNISHEIRTPLNGMLGMVELLRQTVLDSKQEGYAETVTRSGTALLALINDILDLSKIEAGTLELEQSAFDLAALMQEITGLFGEGARAKGLRLDVVLPPTLHLSLVGDQHRLRQVLINLVGNAIKFTNHGGVTVNVALSEDRGNAVVLKFEVADTGIGISTDRQDSVFDPFSQVDGSTTRAFGGTGLGLSIARQICAMMGGEIGLRSEAGQGATFWFTVTLRKGLPTAPNALTTGTTPDAGAPRRVAGEIAVHVLLVEDNAVNMEVGRGLLHSLGCVVTAAVDGQEGVDKFRPGCFDIVLMDLQMPRMDGFAAAAAIREIQRKTGDATPVLALSAHALPGDRAKSLSAGFDDHLTKPVTRAVLAEAIARYVHARDGASARSAGGEDATEAAVIDAAAIDRLREIEAAGNEGLVHRVLRQFLVDGERLVNEIARAVAAGQFDAARQASHTLKSSSAYLGADRLRTCCVRMEEASANADATTQNALIGALRVEYVRASTTLVAMLGTPTPA